MKNAKKHRGNISIGRNFPGMPTLSAGFDAPVELLQACHERIDKQCGTLRRLSKHLETHGSDSNARSASASILRYFEIAGPNHHADEERDVFPVLLERIAPTERGVLQDIVNQLCEEHLRMDAMWGQLRPLLLLITDTKPVILPYDMVDSFVTLYEQHIEREEKFIIPHAQTLLTAEDTLKLSRAMLARRTDNSSDLTPSTSIHPNDSL